MLLDAPIVQAAVGLFFTFTILSLIATQLNSMILNFFNLRAEQLKEGLVNLITDKDLQAKILAHPLIRMVEDQVRPSDKLDTKRQDEIIKAKTTKVSYIPSQTFVNALVSVLTAKSNYEIFKPLDEAITFMENNDDKLKMRELYRDLRSFGETDTKKFREAILALPDENVKQVLSYALEQVEDGLGQINVKSGTLIPLLEGLRQVDNPHFQGAIQTIVASAVSLEDAEGKIESWFDDGMNRIGDIYKRKLQWISLAIGLGMAIVLNADTIQITRALMDDQALRTSVVANVQGSAAALDAAVTGTTDAQGATDTGTTGTSTEQLQVSYDQLLSLQLPIGWDFTPVDPADVQVQLDQGFPSPYENARNAWNLLPGFLGGGNPNWAASLVAKIGGWILTAIAVAQGAPFWFDLLRRLTGGSSSNTAPSVNVSSPPVTVNVSNPGNGSSGDAAPKETVSPPQLETWPLPSESNDEPGAVG
ncbi:MAG: hypothetical protein H6672_01410 [Anaerolineaceae bacterium]|nr:hypothetical protein [Anaerolineaceae bacterium]